MQTGALAPYERALRSAGPLALRTIEGDSIRLDLARWLADVDTADETVLLRCRGPVLDIGCGPGRFVGALIARGVAALGVDIAETAVSLTRCAGRPALLRNVFAALPGEGRWPTLLLIDGNVGIGGDPRRLLLRAGQLLAARGRILVEMDPQGDRDERLRVHFEDGRGPVGPVFDWARIGIRALVRVAAETGHDVDETWTFDDRAFAALRRA